MRNTLKNRAVVWSITGLTLVFASLLGFSTAFAAVTSTLSPGESNAQVTELQTFLATDTSVYPEGLVTGYYGDLTTAAVERFQCKYGFVCSGTPSTTGYGRVGPMTLAKIQGLEGTSGGGVPSGTYGDASAPIIYYDSIAVTPSSNGASFSWNTNEAAHSRVMYGTYWPFLYASAPSVTDPTFDSTNGVVITGLSSNTTYYYVLESVDAAGNVQWTTGKPFQTI